jgi:hypothetical protein
VAASKIGIGKRRCATWTMSRMTAPEADVTTPIRRGRNGSGRLRPRRTALGAQRCLSCSNASASAPAPVGSIVGDRHLKLAARLVQRERPRHLTAIPPPSENLSCFASRENSTQSSCASASFSEK